MIDGEKMSSKWSQKIIGAISIFIGTMIVGLWSIANLGVAYISGIGYFLISAIIFAAVTFFILPEKKDFKKNAMFLFIYGLIGGIIYNMVIYGSLSNLFGLYLIEGGVEVGVFSVIVYALINYFKG
jgi:hypothetical protein